MIAAAPHHQRWTERARGANEALAEIARHRLYVKPYRTIREFAEQEVVIPDGDYQGQLFRVHRQPVHGLWLNEIDSGQWSRFALVACQQSGKTLAGLVIPVLYHLFEIEETVILAAPTMDIAKDKWEVDLLPAIRASRYREFLPQKGSGSKGGFTELMTFSNGARLKFMSGGGGDEKRSAFTSRVLVVTEVDKLDEVGAASDESTKLRQLEGRTRFYGNRKRVYLECTVSEESGRIWQEWLNGSSGLAHVLCASCGNWVAPERDNLIGWQEAEEEIDAEESRFSCPKCGVLWDEEIRHRMLKTAIVLHRGQTADEHGEISGELPRTRTCGLRYSAATNAFADVAMIGVDEWHATRAIDEELAERELLQWTWAFPPSPRVREEEPLEVFTLMQRQSVLPRMILPEDVQLISVGVDARKEQLEWFAVCSRETGGPLCIDYGFEIVPHRETDLRSGLAYAVSELQKRFQYGWKIHGAPDTRRSADIVLLDAHWESDVLYDQCLNDPTWTPSIGYGYNQHQTMYSSPRRSTIANPVIGDGWHLVPTEKLLRGMQRRFLAAHNNADLWKERLHRVLSVPMDHPSALLLPKTEKPDGRKELAKQLTAEKLFASNEAGKGVTRKWQTVYHLNHWLDAAYQSLVGLSIYESRQEAARKKQEASRKASRQESESSRFGRFGGIRRR